MKLGDKMKLEIDEDVFAPSQAQNPSYHEQRRHGRHRVMLSAKLHTAQGASTAVLLDLSEGGALVACPMPLAQGTHVVLTRGRLQAHAVIARVQGRRFGLTFDEPLAPAMVTDVVTPVARWAN